jgi:hypothetical protein
MYLQDLMAKKEALMKSLQRALSEWGDGAGI